MTARRIAITAALLLQLFVVALDAQLTLQTLSQPTPQSRQQLSKAVEEARAKKDVHGEALALMQLGIVEAGLGNVNGARGNLTDAVRKMRAQNDHMGAWVALLLLSQFEVAAGRPSDAIPHLEKAFTVIHEAKASTAPLNLKTFMAFGAISGLSPQMLQKLDEASLAAMKPMFFQFSIEPMTHDLYGSVLTHAGQFAKAEAELKKAAAGSIHAQGMYDFSIESHFGDLRFAQQRYDEARTHYVKALNASAKVPLPPVGDQFIKVSIYDRLARLETITGHPEEAKRWSDKARDLGKKSAEKR